MGKDKTTERPCSQPVEAVDGGVLSSRAMREVQLFFDVVCPFAYLGSTQIEAVCARHGADLVYRPMLLGGVFRAIGRPDHVTLPPARVRYTAVDVDRFARRYGVELRWPAGHPRRTVDAMRLCVAAGARVGEVSRALFHAYWVHGRDLADRTVLDEIARANGVDPALASGDAAKEGLRRNTDDAVAAGVFGAPSYLVTTDHGRWLFWGQDRLHFVEKALAGWRVPA